MDVVSEVFWAGPFLAVRATLAALPLCGVVWLVTWLGRSWLAPRVRYLLWSLVLLRLVMPFGIPGPVGLNQALISALGSLDGFGSNVPTVAPVEPPMEEWTPAQGALLPAPDRAFEVTAPAVPTEAGIPLATWVVHAAYWCGAALCATGLVVSTLRLRRCVARGADVTDTAMREILEEGRRLFGVNSPVGLRIVPGLSGPAAYGVWRPAILLQESAVLWSTTELRHVLWHELSHLARRDVAANVLVSLIRVVQWWNPLYWWAQRNWLAEREGACDALVVSRLNGESPSAYGHTILAFVERMRGVPVATPGFVGFLDTLRQLGRSRSLRRRLEELSRGGKSESRRSRLFTGALVLGLAVIGLTDASAKQITKKPPVVFELPEGAEWVVQPAAEEQLELIAVTYVLSEALARLERDRPEEQRSSVEPWLVEDVRQLLGGKTPVMPSERLADDESKAPAAKEKVLVVRATRAQHDRVSAYLHSISKHGQRQVVYEVRVVTTRVSLADQPGSGQIVVGAADWSATKLPAVTSGDRHDGRVPVYTHHLDPAATALFLAKLKADRETTTTSAPRVTVFEGQSATVQMRVLRPYVTAHKSTAANPEPVVSIIETGMAIELDSQPVRDDDTAIRLGVAYQRSDVVAVDNLTTRVGGRDSMIQVPRVVQSVFRGEAELADGHTLLIAPLRRDKQGRMEFCLVTARREPPRSASK